MTKAATLTDPDPRPRVLMARSGGEDSPLRVCVVGAGTHFLSGISYYTIRLTNALSQSHRTSAITMRRLLPRRFYPGRSRVGATLTHLRFDESTTVCDGVDWYWIPGMWQALALLLRERPHVLLLQWWSGTVLHSYLMIAVAARLLGSSVVIEFHEVLDPGESRLALARAYVWLVGHLVVRLAQGVVVHSDFDRRLVEAKYRLGDSPLTIIPHGPYDQYERSVSPSKARIAPRHASNLLYFGVIRPFKGVEDLLRAFDLLSTDEISGYWLTIVGETWEGWTTPADLIATSKYRDRITFVNRYVSDDEAASFLAEADAMVLPYHRSSSSGPLHVAMSRGLPVIVTRVGGLPEAVSQYEGAILVPPRDPEALRAAMARAAALRGKRFRDPHSWERSVQGYERIFGALNLLAVDRSTTTADRS